MAISYTPPLEVARNARRALNVRKEKPESERGMTLVGLARARQLSNREPVSFDVILRMSSYFARHRVDKQGQTWADKGKGWQAWHGWGGDEGWDWVRNILKEVDMNGKMMHEEINSRQQTLTSALLEITYEEGKFNQGVGADGAHYMGAEDNPFKAKGLYCDHCYFYAQGGNCVIVEGEIDPQGLCKLWVIPEVRITEEQAEEEEVTMYNDEVTEESSDTDEELENYYRVKVNLSQEERDALPDADFALPSSRNFPVTSPVSVYDAWVTWHNYRGDVSFETFKENLIKIALRKGSAYVARLPKKWQDEMNQKMSTIAGYYLRLLDK